jgi:hypothetical protein
MFKRAMKYLDDGVSIMAFPEGARPIDVNGKSESEISAEVRAALLSELPLDQHPLVE